MYDFSSSIVEVDIDMEEIIINMLLQAGNDGANTSAQASKLCNIDYIDDSSNSDEIQR